LQQSGLNHLAWVAATKNNDAGICYGVRNLALALLRLVMQ
jgi:hypothetical protein